jgi:hypothetical protein
MKPLKGPSVWALCLCLLVISSPIEVFTRVVVASDQTTSAQGSYPVTSWALGIVLPEGAGLEAGNKLRWESVRNITAVVRLPDITRPDMPVYAVLSVMTDDGSVLQVAAGVYRNSGYWLAYSDFVPNAGSIPPSYEQILNSSKPQMLPNASVSISIFRSSDLWNLRVVNTDTGTSVERAFPSGISPLLKTGDQEVFALESYSKNQTTFEDMGNLTLKPLLINSIPVIGGFYSYSDWDPAHNPLFAIGSAGARLPIFISLYYASDSAIVWGFTSQWEGTDMNYSGPVDMNLATSLVACAMAAVAIGVAVRRLTNGGEKARL